MIGLLSRPKNSEMSLSKSAPPALLIICLAALSTALHAEENRWYAGLAGEYTNVNVGTAFWSDNSISDATIRTSGYSFGLYGGYRLTPHLSLQADYLQAAKTKFTAASNGSLTIWPAGRVSGITHGDGFAVDALLFWPAQTRAQLYVKGGLMFWDTTTRYSATINGYNEFNDNGTNPIAGAGVQIRLTPRWNMRLEGLYTMMHLASRANVGTSFALIGISRSFSLP